jgi:hypothetical protein
MALLGLCSGAWTLGQVDALSEGLEARVLKGLRLGHRVQGTSLRSVRISIDPDHARHPNADFIRAACAASRYGATAFPEAW